MSNDSDKHKAARGALPWQEGDEPAEVAIARLRGGDTELARVRAVAIAALEAAKIEHGERCNWQLGPCDCGANEHNRAIDAAIAEIGATQEQASDDEPASYPGELWSDGPYKEQLRYDRRDGRGGWGPW
jgi:hypothetical protein